MGGLRACAALAAAWLVAGAADATVVNVAASSPAGTSLSLDAGSYTVALIGTAEGGSYNGWNPFGSTTCTGKALGCYGWTDSFSIGFGGGSVGFHLENAAHTMSYFYAGTAAALADYKAAIAAGSFYLDPNTQPAVTLAGGQIRMALAAPTRVTFKVDDSTYTDNLGGVSLLVTAAVPEPATWASMVAGIGLLGGAMRRRRRAAAGGA